MTINPPGRAEPETPPQPPALARAAALQLVTRQRLRLADQRDGRLGELIGEYQLCVVSWTGAASSLVGFYTPQGSPQEAAADLSRRLAAAARWGADRLTIQGSQRADILLVALAEVPEVPDNFGGNPAVKIGAVWADVARGEAQQLLPVPSGLPGPRELRSLARALHQGGEAPTMAAVDLAERETVQAGYVAPTRRKLNTSPTMTFGLIASFVVVYLLENWLYSQYANLGLLGAGALSPMCHGQPACLGYSGADWWRYLATAFLHQPSGLISFHLLMNSFSMLNIGRVVEQLYGRLMLLGTFVVTAAAGSVLTVVAGAIGLPGSHPDGLSIGASGGICGLLGLLVMLGRVQGKNVPAGLSSSLRQSVLISAGLTVVIGISLSGYINNYAHAGGFVAGMAVGLLLPPVAAIGGRELRVHERAFLVAAIAVAVVALLFAAYNVVAFLQTAPPPLLVPASG